MTRRHIAIIGLAVLVAAIAAWLWNPLWLEDATLQLWVERRVPLGTDITRARDLIRSSGWELRGEWRQPEPQFDYGTRKGSRVVHVYLGHYQAVFRVDVDAFFGFDEHGRLVEIHIRKMVDSL